MAGEEQLEAAAGRPWSFDGDGALFRLVSEAQRIRLAHLFDPLLAVHTSDVEPLPHQITAVYEAMLPRQPLRFLLADDPGAGKTIMAGLLMKELIARGDLRRCLVVCPGSLVEQWRDELCRRFQLPFEILTRDSLETGRTGNWFLETNLALARLDQLSRNEDMQRKLQAPDCRWDLIVCDEAHKMSATVFGADVKYTKRYRLGQLLSSLTRHFLLMTATPHNGKEEDFQLFMALLDADRFEGRFRDGARKTDVAGLVRRVVKEDLIKFDGRPLFPERAAHTVPYRLSEPEKRLYQAVTDYVREEFNRAEKLDDKKKGTVGFAMTVLQRRLASSPEAIYQSLESRRRRLDSRRQELESLAAGDQTSMAFFGRELDQEDIENLEDAPAAETDAAEDEVLDQATAARSVTELRAEIDTLAKLEAMAGEVKHSRDDAKWTGLNGLLSENIFTGAGGASPGQKLVIFTEYRATLDYLQGRITTLLGRSGEVVVIHGGINRSARLKAQEAFRHDPQVRVLLATDAAGEGINLQRAHLMVNYDLPWNPNRLEQRFGRIHRIGQTEVCHLWNLVAEETREGEVYHCLLQKLEQAGAALGGKVFDVIGNVQFEGKSLRELLIEAIRYGNRPEVRARLTTTVNHTLDREHLHNLVEESALAHEVMDAGRVQRIRARMERDAARKLQPHYIQSFFLEAFQQLGGTARQREPRRYQVSHVPALVKERARRIGAGEPVSSKYERITFEKELRTLPEKPPAAFICPGHPLLDAVTDLTLEQHEHLLRRGAVLVDERDAGAAPRVLCCLEHALQDGVLTAAGEQRVISKRMLYVELDEGGGARRVHYSPYLDYRPLKEDEPGIAALLKRPECAWVGEALKARARQYALDQVAPGHLKEVRDARREQVNRTKAAVRECLTKAIYHWGLHAEELRERERAGKPGGALNAGEARKRVEELEIRLKKRMAELELEAQVSSLPPVVSGGALIIPRGLLEAMAEKTKAPPPRPIDTQTSAKRARDIVMEVERGLGFDPVDREYEKLGYDIESRDPNTGGLRFIEVKGRVSGAETVTVTRNEVLFALNHPDAYILAVVEFLDGDNHRVHYARQPFRGEPDFNAASVNYHFAKLLEQAKEPS